ncbi:VOC family protein [Bacillus sp. SCS-153A]|uniref:VOC family protein n=1 Tax=Rossellomorea sedimentorum TaxID=3115294 RepID=UPI003906D045
MRWHHGGIEVTSLKDSVEFYREVFQFEVQSCLRLREEKIVFMSRGPVTIELIENPEIQAGPSSLHFAWEVEDLSWWTDHLEDLGLQPVEGPYCLDSGRTVIFYKGPDGEVFELVSRCLGN